MRPAQTPKIAFGGQVGWEVRRRTVSLVVHQVGNQYEDDLNLRRLPSATTISAFAAWPLTRRLQVVARAQNLLDKTVVATIGDDGTIERATPRTLWLGLRFGH